MIELLSEIHWAAVGQIIMIDILLGGDNAVVIALACRNLPPEQRTKGIMYGTAGAIVLRVILIVFAMSLLSLPWLKLVGGALLLWIGVKLLMSGDEEEHGIGDNSGTTLMSAIRTVIIADLVMSVDNVIGISAAAAQANESHQMYLVIFGLLVSVPIIIWGSRVVLTIMEKYPIIIWIGGALLGWIAGGMMITDPVVENHFGVASAMGRLASEVSGALFVIAVAWLMQSRRPADSPGRS